jgi:hypothetical protein
MRWRGLESVEAFADFSARLESVIAVDTNGERTLHMSTSADKSTWQPTQNPAEHGRLDAAQVNALPDSAFAFPRSRKEPMTDASHVRSALARFNQVADVSDADRELAFINIKKAAQHYNVAVSETDWRQLSPRGRSKA